jgi:hypothetical protein
MAEFTGTERFFLALGRQEGLRQLRILAEHGAVDAVEHPLTSAGLWVETGIAEIFHTDTKGGWHERHWALTEAGRQALQEAKTDDR